MEPITGMVSGTVYPSHTTAYPLQVVDRAGKGQGIKENEIDGLNSTLRSKKDIYVSEKKQEPTGRYWLGRDEDGHKIYFDDPGLGQAAFSQQPEERMDAHASCQERKEEGAEKNAGTKTEKCVGNTDKVDREIKKLKKERTELEQRLNVETEAIKIKELEKKLAQVEGELKRKDNDAYRRRHSEFVTI